LRKTEKQWRLWFVNSITPLKLGFSELALCVVGGISFFSIALRVSFFVVPELPAEEIVRA